MQRLLKAILRLRFVFGNRGVSQSLQASQKMSVLLNLRDSMLPKMIFDESRREAFLKIMRTASAEGMVVALKRRFISSGSRWQRLRLCAAAARVYVRGSRGSYDLNAANF